MNSGDTAWLRVQVGRATVIYPFEAYKNVIAGLMVINSCSFAIIAIPMDILDSGVFIRTP